MIANRMSAVSFSPTIRIANKAKELKASGVKVCDFTVGEPDFNTPDFIKQAGIDAINNNDTRYTMVNGTIELRKAIAHKLKRDNNLNYDISEIVVTNGAKQMLFNALFATLNQNDEVIIPAPSWVSYFDIVKLCDGTPIIVNTKEDNKFKLTAQELETAITNKTKWLMLNSPSNPTGGVYSKEELISLIEVLRKNPNVNIIVDDIYEYLCYDCTFFTIPELAPDLLNRILVVNGVSKSFAMTGWRVGYGVSKNKKLMDVINVIQSQSTSSVCSISQHAAAVALMDDERNFLKDWINEYKTRRNFCVKRINKIKHLSCTTPDGAFYVFFNIKNTFNKRTAKGDIINNSEDFAINLLEDFAVATVHGEAFGMEGYIRLSFVTSMDELSEGLDKIEQFCNSLS
ncbi:MAG: hypothetical protein RL208_751 [Pseudomonadota bacterium]|jgi:aspartate aminotransferase